MKTEHFNKYVNTLLQKKQNTTRNETRSKKDEEDLDWKIIYPTSLQATKVIKLQNCSCKFLMCIIPTNRYF